MTPRDESPAAEDARSIVMTRTLSAPRELVWETLTDPKHIPFFWGPRGFSTTISEMDVRPGGHWRYVMHGHGADYVNWVRYTEVARPSLLAYDHGGDDPAHALFRARIELEAVEPERTRVTLRLIFDTAEARDRTAKFGAESGGHETLARLEEAILAARTDLAITRIVDVPATLLWKAWTEPEHLKQWWCPKPWMTTDCRIDLRPGGEFYTLMRGPEGEEHGGSGCFLEVVPLERLVWTSALEPGYRPSSDQFMPFTAIITFEQHAGKTRYTARALHATPDSRKRHEEMGFHHGWNAALDQLVDLAGRLRD